MRTASRSSQKRTILPLEVDSTAEEREINGFTGPVSKTNDAPLLPDIIVIIDSVPILVPNPTHQSWENQTYPIDIQLETRHGGEGGIRTRISEGCFAEARQGSLTE